MEVGVKLLYEYNKYMGIHLIWKIAVLGIGNLKMLLQPLRN